MAYASYGRSLIAVAVIAVTTISPGFALAQTCYDLGREKDRVGAAAVRLLADYPATNLVIGMCAATASDTYQYHLSRGMTEDDAAFEGVATFGACAIVGCLLAGFDRCVEVSQRWFELALASDRIDQHMRRNRCP